MKIPTLPVKTVLLLISLLLLPAPVSAQGDAPVVHKLAPALQQKVQFLNPEYLVYTPVGSSNAKLSLLIFLHGAGGVGQDIQQIKARPTDVWKGIEKFGKGPCIVVAPQCLKTANGERGIWTAEDLNLVLQHLKATLPVDDRRIYLSGISMGGYGTWAWAAHDPQHFAAIAPIVGGIGREGAKAVTPDFDQWAASLAKIPVYAFVGALDTTVPPERSERMIAAIKKAGGKEAKLKVYPEEAHGAGRVVVADPEYYDWIFAQQRDASPQPAVSTAGSGTATGKL
jgi:predicted peptidase